MSSATSAEWPLLERDETLEQVRALLDVRKPRGLVVAGENGLGKTRVLAEVRGLFDERRDLVNAVSATRSAASVPLGAIAHLLPESPSGNEAVEDPANVTQLLRVITSRWAGHAGKSRKVLIVDDAHLLDDASAAVVHSLAMAGVPTVAAIDPEATTPDAIQALWKDLDMPRLELDPLSAHAVGELVRLELSGPVEGASLATLVATVEGNPLMLREVISATHEAGAWRHDGPTGLWKLTPVLPVSAHLRQTAERDLALLDRDALQVARLLAFVPRLPLRLVEIMFDRAAIGRGEAAGVLTITRSGRRASVRLTREVHRQILRATTPVTVTRELHARYAQQLASTGTRRSGDRLELVRSQLAAGITPDPELALNAAGEAAHCRDHALVLELMEIGGAGGTHPRDQPLTRVMPMAEAYLWLGDHARTDEMLAAALEIDATDAATRRQVLLTLGINAFVGHGRLARARQLFEQVLGDDPGDTLGQHALALETVALLSAGHVRDALALVQDHACLHPLAQCARVAALTWAGQPRTACREVRVGLGDTDPSAESADLVAFAVCTALTAAGEFQQAGSRAVEGYHTALTDACAATVRANWSFVTGHLRLFQGAIPQAHEALAEAAVLMRERPASLGPAAHGYCLACLAETQVQLGQREAARRSLNQAAELPLDECARPVLQVARAWVTAADGDLHAARRQALDAAAEATAHGVHLTAGQALLAAARLGATREAAAGLAETTARCESSVIDSWNAYAQALNSTDRQQIHVAADRLGEAGHELLSAELVTSFHAPHVPADLYLPGETERPSLGLSNRELDIARIAAAGESNQTIAERLHLSTRTVETHLYNTYRKLSIERRGELRRVLAAYESLVSRGLVGGHSPA